MKGPAEQPWLCQTAPLPSCNAPPALPLPRQVCTLSCNFNASSSFQKRSFCYQMPNTWPFCCGAICKKCALNCAWLCHQAVMRGAVHQRMARRKLPQLHRTLIRLCPCPGLEALLGETLS